MRTYLHAVTLLALAGPALATPPAGNPPAVTVPPTLTADVGQILLPIATNGKLVKVVAPAGVVPLPQYQPGATVPYAYALVILKPGTYCFWFYTALGDVPSDAAKCVLTVGSPPPDPPPTPPTPPTPPAPVDPLVQALQTAYASETAADKASTLAALTSLYGQATYTAQLPSLQTWGDLADTMATAAKTLGISGKLPAVQTAIAGELKKTLPTDRGAPLDSAGRDLAASAFKRISTALAQVKGK